MNAIADLPTIERAVIDGAVHVPVHLIKPNPWNRQLDAKKLAEFALSVKKHGVIQPIVVRPIDGAPAGAELYELVAGERRWRASIMAELATVPALVRPMSDLEVVELMLIENLEREGLHELDEAEGYSRLLRKADGLQGFATVELLAERIGKSVSYVFQRMKLLHLCDAAKLAFREGDIEFSHAICIARIPRLDDQVAALKAIVDGWAGHRMSAREAQAFVQERYMLGLDRAVFKITDAALLPEAGSCRECGKRTGANPDLFNDVKKGDTCTDPTCFHAKEEAHRVQLRAAAEAAGKTVIAGAEAKKAKPQQYGQLKGYLKVDEVHHQLNGSKPLRKLLGKNAPETMLFEDPHTKELVEVVREADAVASLKASGVLKTAKMPTGDARMREAERKAKAEQAWRAAVAEACVTAAGTDAGDEGAFRSGLLGRLAALLWDEQQQETRALVMKLLGWPQLVGSWHQGPGITAAAHIAGLSDRQLCQYFVAASVAGEIQVAQYSVTKPERLKATAAALGVDGEAIRAELRRAALKRVPSAKKATAKAVKRAGELTPETALAGAMKKAKAKGPPMKYRNAATGETWSGRGPRPAWLRAAIAGGSHLEDFATAAPARPASHISAAAADVLGLGAAA